MCAFPCLGAITLLFFILSMGSSRALAVCYDSSWIGGCLGSGYVLLCFSYAVGDHTEGPFLTKGVARVPKSLAEETLKGKVVLCVCCQLATCSL